MVKSTSKEAAISLSLSHTPHPSFNGLIQELCDLNYSRVSMVLEPGDFCVRGSIIDVYAFQHTHPIRIEYDLDEIVRLNRFHPNTQRSLAELKDTSIPANTGSAPLKAVASDISDPHIISNLFEGDPIIHEHYGLGIYEGLITKKFSDMEGEFICCRYAGDTQVFVPLNQLNLIHKYSQEDGKIKLDSLSGKQWSKKKLKAKEDTQKLASDLFTLYKKRQLEKGFKYGDDTDYQLEVEDAFPYPLTPDQKEAVSAIKKDMESIRPMERLLCGDVGFGKTEVLLRAAVKALENNKQVAVLVPTTILAEQHYQTFVKRLSDSPYIIRCLSRFSSKSEQKATVKALKSHQCDCVIATHRLLSKDIQFLDLGLLIIDEEQRFGVKHKEHLKSLKASVDIISVSATPIPRTLYMSLGAAKDFSLIQTPPPNRLPILTSVAEYDIKDVANAIHAELDREGQVYYVYNDIRSIHKKAAELKKHCPECRIAVAHGQMKEHHIKAIIDDFKSKKTDCLLSTTIIENGIDIPSANTMIIDRAERFGLAQIHQLRGRIGRSNIQAFCHIVYSNNKTLSEKAKQRLQAIREYVSLGSGYDIAIKDLEIRGAGNLLGKEQHGHIVSVGFNYYCKLLEEASHEKRGLPLQRHWLSLDTKKMTLSPDFIPAARERLSFYHRFMTCHSMEELKNIKRDLEDRYGRLPTKVETTLRYIQEELG